MKRDKFVTPEGFEVLELECDEHNLVQFQMLGKVLKRQEKDIDRQMIALGRKIYDRDIGGYLSSVKYARRIAEEYRKELNDWY